MATLSTELDAVNTMLATIGESPVSTLEDNGLADAAIAKQTLNTVNRQVQSSGWHFNTEEGIELIPSYPQKYLQLPENTLRVDSIWEDEKYDVVQRGYRLYDRIRHSYQFEKGLKVTLVLLLDFNELPEAARQYITIRAARQFQAHVVGAAELDGFTQRDEYEARVALRHLETDNGDYNVYCGSYSVASILER